MAQVLIIVAPQNFRDEEAFEPKRVLEETGHTVQIASKDVKTASGSMGGNLPVDIDITQINVENYDAILFVGGPGAHTYFDDPTAHEIARKTLELDKILGAICIGPVILANAGILNGRKATVWNGDRKQSKLFEEKKAEYTGEPVTVDGNLVTSDGPSSAHEFGEKLAQMLESL